MDRFLQNDLVIKVLSVILAITLWFVATGEKGEIQKPFANVPVHPRNLDSDLIVTNFDPATVTVTVRTDQGRMNTIDRSSFDAFVNLTGSRPGRVGVEVEVTVPVGVTLVDLTPKMVDVSIESVVEKDVPVTVTAMGTPAKDYELGDVVSEADTVRVRGPESEVAIAARAVGQISVDGASQDVTADVRLFVQDDKGNPLNQTVVIPAYVATTVVVNEVAIERELPVKAVVTGQPAAGFKVGTTTIEPTTVKVVGAKSVVNALTVVPTADISVEGASEDVQTEVDLTSLDGVDSMDPTRVLVTISIVKE